MDTHTNTFSHDGHTYDLTIVRKLLQKRPAFLLSIKSMLWIFAHDTPSEERIFKARLRYPLIVAKYQGKWAVVDGLHRLEKYRRRGFVRLPVKEATPDILKKALIH